MKKHFVLIALAFISYEFLDGGRIQAQHLLTPSNTLNKYQEFNTLTYDSIHIRNNSQDTLFLSWELLQYDSANLSYIDFCSSGNCWLGVPQTGSFPPIPPASFGWAGVHFWTGDIEATASARIWLYKSDSSAIGDTLSYYLHAVSANGFEPNLNQQIGLKIYPNPCINKVFVSSEANAILNNVYLINCLGETVFSQSYTTSSTEIWLDKLPKGVYFIGIRSGESSFCKKIILSD